MAENKKSFILYTDQSGVFNQLPDEIAGKLIKHIFAYVNDENPICDDLIINIAFEPIKQSLKRDLKRYKQYIEKQSLNGAKGGRPKKATETQETQPFFEKPKKADSVSVSDSVNDNEKQYSNEFLEIWEIYHKRGNKKKSQELYNKLTNAKKELIKKHLPLYIQNHIENNKLDFLKHFTTYLNGEVWNDELPYSTKTPQQTTFHPKLATLHDE